MRDHDPTRVVTADEMRAIDQAASDVYGIPGLLLMENAGSAVAAEAVSMLGGCAQDRRVLIACGPGNNGGDGFVAARRLHNAGALVTIAFYGDGGRVRNDALTNLQIAENMRLPIEESPSQRRLADLLQECDLLIDALLGTGFAGEPRDPYKAIIPVINSRSCRCRGVLAVDIPSGVNADTGTVLGTAVRADATVTFALPKIGLVTWPGAEYVGRLVVADISIPSAVSESVRTFLLEKKWLSSVVGQRRADSHKGDFGHVAVVAGSVGMTGAAALAAEGSLRTGAGLVTVGTPESLNDILEVKLTEAMSVPIPECTGRAFGKASVERALELIANRDAAVVGPGLGRINDTVDFALALIRGAQRPLVVDADGLYALSTDLAALKARRALTVITPHPGEMAALVGTAISDVQSNRLGIARDFARKHRVIVVLKGAATVVAAPDGKAYINTSGTAGMATGGTGDVLSGMIGAALAGALGPVDPLSAVCVCVYLHGRAGEMAAEIMGQHAMLASDVARAIGTAFHELSSQRAERE